MATVSVGDRAPEFSLPDQDGNLVTLSQLLTTGPVVLFFYPIASSAGCTQEACHFRDLAAEFAAHHAHRIGISTDAVDKQKAFDDGNALGYPLVSDESGEVATAYGVKRGLLGKLAPVKRKTFVIGTDGVVKAVIGSETKMAVHADDALKALAAS
jgi:thioredoxin-dependent peroxiredoxin